MYESIKALTSVALVCLEADANKTQSLDFEPLLPLARASLLATAIPLEQRGAKLYALLLVLCPPARSACSVQLLSGSLARLASYAMAAAQLAPAIAPPKRYTAQSPQLRP